MQQFRDERLDSSSKPVSRLAKGEVNIVGLTGLIFAILGLALANFGISLYVVMFLALAGFVLGALGIGFKCKEKISPITAIAVSVVGAIIAAFLFGMSQREGAELPDSKAPSGGSLNGTYGSLNSNEGSSPSADRTTSVRPPREDGPTGNAIGSRENPAPIGETVSLSGWDFTVTRFDRNGTAEVLAANRLNDPPSPGSQYFLLALTATYTGAGSSSTYGIEPKFVTDAGNVIKGGGGYAVPPSPRFVGQEVYSGASVDGHVVYEMPEGTQGLLRLNGDGLYDTAFVDVN